MSSPWTVANMKPDYLPGIRLPVRSSLTKLIGKMPFWVDMFNETLVAFQSDENRFTMIEDFWWVASVASFTAGSQSNPPFAFQLYELQPSSEPAGKGFTHQQKAVNSENYFGTAQRPFYLTKPVFMPAGTQLLCRAQNMQNAVNVIQVAMMGYME